MSNKLYGVKDNKSLLETIYKGDIDDLFQELRDETEEAITKIHNAAPLMYPAPVTEEPTLIGHLFDDDDLLYRQLIDLSDTQITLTHSTRNRYYMDAYESSGSTVCTRRSYTQHFWQGNLKIKENVNLARCVSELNGYFKNKFYTNSFVIQGTSYQDSWKAMAGGEHGIYKVFWGSSYPDDITSADSVVIDVNTATTINASVDFYFSVVDNDLYLNFIVTVPTPAGSRGVTTSDLTLTLEDFKVVVDYVESE